LGIDNTLRELKSLGIIKRKVVEEALRRIPRSEFLPSNVKQYADLDSPIPIGYNQTTSAIHMVAMLCEITDLNENDIVLEIGTGSGYMAAVYNFITKREVFSIEIIKELANFAKSNLKKVGLDPFIHVINADATHSLPFRERFDVIIVTACSKNIPKEYTEMLKENGRMAIPVGFDQFYQDLFLVKKDKEGKVLANRITTVAFVPLKGSNKIFKESE
jgi:Protein-L-isoaspartate carboxylmethyltransferase